jgi:Fur family ferric uptake transcriptional regulator
MKAVKSSALDFRAILKEKGFKATPGRLQLLEALAHVEKPLTVMEIKKRLHSRLNEVTLYRALEAFEHMGMVRRVDLNHDHAHYELALGRLHHDHVVCAECGTVEDIEGCALTSLQKSALKQSGFTNIYSHNLEFFGLCKQCA